MRSTNYDGLGSFTFGATLMTNYRTDHAVHHLTQKIQGHTWAIELDGISGPSTNHAHHGTGIAFNWITKYEFHIEIQILINQLLCTMF